MTSKKYGKIITEKKVDDQVTNIKLDHGEKNNVLDLEMILELNDAITKADRDKSIQGIILGTTSDIFCSGADVSEIKELGFEEGSRWLDIYFETVDLLRDTGKPTIAAVKGPCVAGGNELVMGCDLVVAGKSAKFGQPEVKVGSTAAGGGLQLLPLIVGEKRAREMILTGEPLSAETAQDIGLINRVVPDEKVEKEAMDLIQEVIEKNSPQAYRVMKSIMKQWSNLAMLNWESTREMTSSVWASEEFNERAKSFLKKEKAKKRNFMGITPEDEEEE